MCLFSKTFALRLRVMLTTFFIKIEADKFDKGKLNTVTLALCGSEGLQVKGVRELRSESHLFKPLQWLINLYDSWS